MSIDVVSAMLEIETVIPIDPQAKYAVVVSQRLSDTEMQRLKERVMAWWNDPNERVMIISGGAELRKLGE